MTELNTSPVWYILGAGAIGLLWAAKLQRQSIPCKLITRANNTSGDTSQHQISVLNLDQSLESFPMQVIPVDKIGKTSTSASVTREIQYLLLTTKAYQSLNAIESVALHLAEDATIVLLQNGMGQHQSIMQRLPNSHVLAATTTEGALLREPFAVQHTGHGKTVIGSFGDTQPLSTFARRSLQCIGMVWVDDIERLLWQKLVINAVINPLTAIYQCRNGELITCDQYKAHAQQLSAEIDHLLQSLNLTLFDTPTFTQVALVAQATAINYSSMYQDIAHARKTELPNITGFILQQAEKFGINCPQHRQIMQHIQRLEAADNTPYNTFDNTCE